MKRKTKSTPLIVWLDKHSGGVIAIFTVVLACATIVYVIFTFNILRQTKKQAEITNNILLHSKKVAELTNRPYIGIGTYNVRIEPNIFSFELSLVNVGVQPATDVMLGYDWSPVDKDWTLQQEVDGKAMQIKRGQIQHIFIGAPTSIFPEVILVKSFSIGYNRTLEYWLKKYGKMSLIITIYYRGIEPMKQEDYYTSRVQLVYRHDKKKWDVERSEVH